MKFAISRRMIALSLVSLFVVLAVVQFGPTRGAGAKSAPFAAVLSATKTATLQTDVNGNGLANPGDSLRYLVTINNTGVNPGTDTATGVAISDTIDANTTLVGGTTIASAVAVNDTYSSIGNVGISVPSGASSLLGNDFDANNPASTTALVIVSPATASTQGGNLSINPTTGAFTYNPPPGFEGTDTFTYALSNGTTLTDTATVSITVTGMIWFVNNGGAACTTLAAGCGRLSTPFSSLATFQALNNGIGNNPAANDNIFVYESATGYGGGVTLLSGQKLIGQDATATLAAISGVTVPTFSNTLPAMNTAGNAASIQNAAGNAITLNQNNTIRGLTISGTSGAGMIGSAITNLTVGSDVTTTGVTGNDLDLSGTATGAITFGATVTNTAGRSISIQNRSGGTVDITGPISDTGTGLLLNSNTGATISFTGGMSVSTGANAAFTATGGGTVNATQNNTTIVNTLTTTTGTALNVTSTNIGVSGLTFRSISVTGNNTLPSSGIILNGTGANGGLTISGNSGSCTSAGTCSGGAIQNTGGDGISLTNTQKVFIDRSFIFNTVDSGIAGTQVVDFSLTNSKIDSSGNASAPVDDRSNVSFGFQPGVNPTNNNISGVVTITGNTLTNAYEHGIDIQNFSGTISNATIQNNALTSSTSSSTSHGSGVRLLGFGSTSVTSNIVKASISGNTITNFPGGAGITAQYGNTLGAGGTWGTPGSSVNVILIQGNFINGQSNANPVGANAILGTLFGAGQAAWKIDNNGTAAKPITNVCGTAIGINVQGASPIATADITNNRIVGFPCVGAQAISYGATFNTLNTDAPQLSGKITGNTVTGQDGNGLIVLAGSNSNASISATITGNSFAGPSCSGCNRFGILLDSGSATATVAGVHPSLCLDISGNTSAGSGVNSGIGLTQRRSDYVFNFKGFGGSTAAQAAAYVDSQNPAGGGPTIVVAGSVFGSCTPPPIAAPSDEAGNTPHKLDKRNQASLNVPIESGKTGESRAENGDFEADAAMPLVAYATGTVAVQLLEDMQAEPFRFVGLLSRLSEMIQPTVKAEGVPNGQAAPFAGETVSRGLGTLPPGKNIRVQFDATVNAAIPTNTFAVSNTANITAAGGININSTTATTTVVQPPTLSKAFGAANIALNTPTTLTFTIGNANPATAFTNVAFSDILPAGMVFATPNGLVNNCGGGTVTATQNTNVFSVSALSRAANSSCTMVVNVTASTEGAKNNTTGTIASTQGGTGLTASASTNVITAPSFTKSFGAAAIPVNGSTSLSFTVTNNSPGFALSGIAFTDTLPAGLVVATPNGASGTCGAGTVTAVAGSGTVTLAGGTLAASANCTFSVNVTGTTAGLKSNSVQMSSTELGAGATANTSVTVVAPPTIAKSFNPTTVLQNNGFSTMTIAITSPAANTVALTGVGVTDSFPSGMAVDPTPTATNSCGTGTFSPVAGATSISVSGATIPIATTCNFTVRVRGTSSGALVNTTGNVTSTNGGNGLTASAMLTVTNTATWNGSASSNWATNTNWTPNVIPISTNDVDIPAAGVVNNPTISAGSVSMNNVSEASGRTLTINSGLSLTAGGTCTINGTMTVAGSFTCGTLAGTGTVNFTGAAAQNIPALAYPNLTINNAAGVTLAGNVTVNGFLTLTNGNITTGANTLTIATGGSISRTSGFVIGSLKKDFVNGTVPPPEVAASNEPNAPAAVFVFTIGTATGYSPITANVTGGSTGSLTVAAFDGTIAPLPNATTINRYWQMSETGTLTADLTFQYLLADVDGVESTYRLTRVTNAGQALGFPNGIPCNPGAGSPCVNTANHTIFVAGVQSFENFWTAGALAPTAASVSVSGKVMTPDGRGLRNAKVVITDSKGVARTVTTSSFGLYQFDDVTAGEGYVIGVVSKQYRFAPRLLQVFDSVTGEDFFGLE